MGPQQSPSHSLLCLKSWGCAFFAWHRTPHREVLSPPSRGSLVSASSQELPVSFVQVLLTHLPHYVLSYFHVYVSLTTQGQQLCLPFLPSI